VLFIFLLRDHDQRDAVVFFLQAREAMINLGPDGEQSSQLIEMIKKFPLDHEHSVDPHKYVIDLRSTIASGDN